MEDRRHDIYVHAPVRPCTSFRLLTAANQIISLSDKTLLIHPLSISKAHPMVEFMASVFNQVLSK